ncbi:MAG: YebC/PmpR family DNA-binding transcriptional regulator [Gemmatimonadota bacterium]|nr:YebC/PmpR family DNA-binding transcriptional regulator [Gemmatimonadota bacterium]
MAGHNKWSQIKRKKGVNDQARGRMFAKLGRELAVAAREGGGDPAFNPRLRLAVDNARAQNMPNDNIERAIKRGTGDLPGTSFEEITYEGYAPGGVALFMECLTDNANRTVAELRHILDKRGGNLGQSGSVAWMFERRGQIYLDAERCSEEAALEAALEAGAEEFEADEGTFIVTTEAASLHAVQDELRQAGLPIQEAEVAMVPISTIRVEGREAERVIAVLEAVDEHDDVQRVFSNADIDDTQLVSAEPS